MLLGQMSIWGHLSHWDRKVVFSKNAITCPFYIPRPYIVTLTYPLASDPLSHLWDQQATWGQSGVTVSKPAGYAVCDGNMSSFFPLLSSSSHNLLLLPHALSDFDKTWSE